MRCRREVGCWVTGAGGSGRAPFPEPANAGARARGGGAAGGQVALGSAIQATRLQPHRPRVGRGWRAVLGKLGLSCGAVAACSGSIFPSLPRPLAASPSGVRWQRASWATLGSVPAGGELHATLHLPTPARRPRGKRAPQGLAAASGSAWRWTCWSGLGLRKLGGHKRVLQLALWGRGQDDQPFYCLTQLPAEMGVLRLRPASPTPAYSREKANLGNLI